VSLVNLFQVACLLGFIIDMTVSYTASGFTSFSTINGFIQAVIWFILHLLHALPQILANYYIVSCSTLPFLSEIYYDTKWFHFENFCSVKRIQSIHFLDHLHLECRQGCINKPLSKVDMFGFGCD